MEDLFYTDLRNEKELFSWFEFILLEMDLTKSTKAQKHKILCPPLSGSGREFCHCNFAIAIAIGVVLYNEQGSMGDRPIKIT